LGVRLASFFGGDGLSYATADSTLIKEDRVNTLAISAARTNSLNLELQLKYRFLEHVNRLDFGNDRYRHSANLGFVGLTFRP
jgi:hypothetical protein